MAGTYGYIAPEVAASGTFTEKTDVFAFGAVVLEVVCGRRALESDVTEDKMILLN
jgi:serine/threonine protein kinase